MGETDPDGWDDPTRYGGGWAVGPSIGSARFGAVLRRPPGVLFHVGLAVPATGLLYAASSPGFAVLLFIAAAWGLAIGALVWCARAAACAFTRQRPRVQGRAAWFLVAPVCGAVVAGLLVADVPLRARWSLAADDFERALELAPAMSTDPTDPLPPGAPLDPVRFDAPDRIGGYRVNRASRVPAGVLFHLGGGGIGFSDAGFAHIPGGPPGGLGPHGPTTAYGNTWYETITFRPLGDDWYAWSAVQ